MKILISVGILIGISLLLWVGWGVYVITSTERPSYQVLGSLPQGVEIRRYGGQAWIATDYRSDETSFRILASYIFGGNDEGRKVAMTAPVITDEKMYFILPEGLNTENAPAPLGQPIDFIEVAPRTLATLRFSWWTPRDRVQRQTARLLDVLREHAVTIRSEPFLMRYNDPWTPPFLRRNEVAIEVVWEDSEQTSRSP